MKKISELLLEEAGYQDTDGMPDYTCSECFYQGTGFKTITYNTMDGTDFDMECPECGSVEIVESPSAAFDRMRDRYDAAEKRISELEHQIGTCNRCLFLHPKESEQDKTKAPHICRLRGTMLHHRGEHPVIPKPSWCPLMRTMSMEGV